MLHAGMVCMNRSFASVRDYFKSIARLPEGTGPEGLAGLPDDIRRVIEASRDAAAMDAALNALLETYPDGERAALRTRIIAALGLRRTDA